MSWKWNTVLQKQKTLTLGEGQRPRAPLKMQAGRSEEVLSSSVLAAVTEGPWANGMILGPLWAIDRRAGEGVQPCGGVLMTRQLLFRPAAETHEFPECACVCVCGFSLFWGFTGEGMKAAQGRRSECVCVCVYVIKPYKTPFLYFRCFDVYWSSSVFMKQNTKWKHKLNRESLKTKKNPVDSVGLLGWANIVGHVQCWRAIYY